MTPQLSARVTSRALSKRANLAAPRPLTPRTLPPQGARSRHAGWLVTASAYDWNVRVAEPKLWLGGREAGERARDGIASALGPPFSCTDERDVAMWTRKAARRFELDIVNVLTWHHTV